MPQKRSEARTGADAERDAGQDKENRPQNDTLVEQHTESTLQPAGRKTQILKARLPPKNAEQA
jgi:hypothetical protein